MFHLNPFSNSDLLYLSFIALRAAVYLSYNNVTSTDQRPLKYFSYLQFTNEHVLLYFCKWIVDTINW